jgi:hypothetical protein
MCYTCLIGNTLLAYVLNLLDFRQAVLNRKDETVKIVYVEELSIWYKNTLLFAVLSTELRYVTCEVLFIVLIALLQEVGCHVLGSVLCREIPNNAIL